MSEPVPASAPLGTPLVTTHRLISYTYPSTLLRTRDSLYRLTEADYSTGEYYHYAYDPVGNRLQLTKDGGQVTNYVYDAANRLTSVNGVGYTWDNNGNPSTSSGQACQNALTMGDCWIPEPDELQRFIGGLGGGIAGHAIIGGGLAYNYELPELFSKTIGGR